MEDTVTMHMLYSFEKLIHVMLNSLLRKIIRSTYKDETNLFYL